MKKTLALLVAVVMAVTLLAGCTGGNNASSAAPSGSAGASSATSAATGTPSAAGNLLEGNYKVGVIQYVSHPALDASYQGFVDALAEAGLVEGENLTIDLQNANGEMNNCHTIASTLANGGYDLVLAIATPAAQAMANATSETQDLPVLITAVTDPQDAGLVESNEVPGNNITGTSDLTPVRQQMELLKQLVPDAQTVGLLYCSSEANSIFQIGLAKAAAEELGLETIEFTVSNANDVQSVTRSMAGRVDAAYSPTDNMIANTMATVASTCIDMDVPLIVGESGMVSNGGLASYSVDYYELGRITAGQAVDILSGVSTPAEMPILYQENYMLELNEETATALGITIPEDLQ